MNEDSDVSGELFSEYLLQNASNKCQFYKHEWLLVKFIFMSVIGAGVAIFGIFGNLAIIAVLTKPAMRTVNNLYLTVLAIFDALVLLPCIMLYSLEYVNEYFDKINLYLIWIESVPYCYSLTHFAQTGSVYITVSVTFERYLAVLHPKMAAVLCTRHRSAVIVISVTCFAALFNCTKLYEIKVAAYNCSGFASRELVASDLLSNEWYSTVYSLWLTHFVMVFIPFTVLITVNTAIAWNFKKSLRQMAYIGLPVRHKQLKEQSRDATRVLVTIVLVFLICNCWGFVTTLMESIYGIGFLRKWAPGFYTFSREVINFLAIVNSSINFLICCVFGREFRHELLKMCGLRRRSHASGGGASRKSLPETTVTFGGSPAITTRLSRPSVVPSLRYVDRVWDDDDEDESSSCNETTPRASSVALMEAAKHFIIKPVTYNLHVHRQSMPAEVLEKNPIPNGILRRRNFSQDCHCSPALLHSRLETAM